MRPELEYIQRIENYLLNKLSAEEYEIFNQELQTNSKLQNDVAQQKLLLEGLKKVSFKAKAKNAYKKYQFQKKLLQGLIGGGLSILVLGILFTTFYKSKGNDIQEKISEKTEEVLIDESLNENHFIDSITPNISENTAETFDYLPSQSFKINNQKDTVIKTKEGLLFAIPKNAFLNQNGSTVNTSIDIQIQEAITAKQIITSGLSTLSNGELLETAGMFSINAFANGENLQLNKEIFAELPTDKIKEDMLLFDGEKNANGEVNWVNPQKIENWLTPKEITSLNFYPPNYENTLIKMGFGNKSKAWKDSVYFSFAVNIESSEELELEITQTEKDYKKSKKQIGISKNFFKEINPVKIKTIWDKKFNNTNLATKEFEERLQYIFTTCNSAVLNLYIDNLNKNLWEIDVMASKLLTGEQQNKFIEFSKRKDTRVKTDENLVKKLGEYYNKQQKEYSKEIQKLQDIFWTKQNEASQKFNEAKFKNQQFEIKREFENFNKEFQINLTNVNEQLGIKPFKYKFKVSSLGMKNIDRYAERYIKDVLNPTWQATQNRQSTTINYNGKTAEIKYNLFTVKVKNNPVYDRIYVYLLPKKLFSFQRMKQEKGIFSEKLNEFIQYDLIVIGYQKNKVFLYQQNSLNTKGGKIEVDLQEVSEKELDEILNSTNKQTGIKDVKNDLDFEKIKIAEELRKKEVEAMTKFRNEIESVIFPCKLKDCPWESYGDINLVNWRLNLNKTITVDQAFKGKLWWDFIDNKQNLKISLMMGGDLMDSVHKITWVSPTVFYIELNHENNYHQTLMGGKPKQEINKQYFKQICDESMGLHQ